MGSSYRLNIPLFMRNLEDDTRRLMLAAMFKFTR